MKRGEADTDLSERFWDRSDRRQLFALDTESSDRALVYMEHGDAERLRSDARSGRLVCPIPQCPNTSFITVGGSRRHHFRHYSAGVGGHEGESYAHHTAKHLIGRWAIDRYPDATVSIDNERLDNHQLPDVLVTMPDGCRYAIEIQYSALTESDWRIRHDGYASQGIFDVWILGHLAPNLRRSRREENKGNPQPGPLHVAIHSAGLPLIWINPFKELIATGLLDLDDGERLELCDGRDFWGRIDLAVEPLALLELTNGTATTPALARHRLSVDGERALRDAEHERQARAERLDALERARRKRVAESQQERARLQAEQRRARHEAMNKDWQDFSEQVVRPRFDGQIPDFVTRTSPGESDLHHRHPSYWRARLFLEFVEGHVGESWDLEDLVRDLRAEECDTYGRTDRFVGGFLLRLQQLGYLQIDSGTTRNIKGKIHVLADMAMPPRAMDPTPPPVRAPSQSRAVSTEPQPPPSRPEPVPESELSDLLREHRGTHGRRRWGKDNLIYVRRPNLRRVPEVITDEGPHCTALGVHPPLWHHLLIEACIDRHIGRRVDELTAAVGLGFDRRPSRRIEQALMWYLDHLADWGLLELQADGSYNVIADLHGTRPTRVTKPGVDQLSPSEATG